MIQCGQCGFPVNETMRYALMQNSCPACGSQLFSNKDSNLITMIQNKLLNESFSASFKEETMYDVSLFLFNELKYGIGKQMRDELIIAEKIVVNEFEEDEEDDEEEDSIRKEIERELEEELNNLNEDGDVETADVFTKAERLKRLHEQRVKSNPGLTTGAINNGKKRTGSKAITRLG